ncbi:MAG: GNAT family N-acetyltransferase [Alphaproteobacteria bacterium]|nr:GNAT family N-acetyltransferase [Alphaproteobacteria bacterium]
MKTESVHKEPNTYTVNIPVQKILKTSHEVMPYLEHIIQIGDNNRTIFGFLPRDAYKQKIEQEKLWVSTDDAGNYLGHLMYGGKYSEIRIYQIYSSPENRTQGVASSLIQEIVKYGEQVSCLNLRADVASDLTAAMRFYQGQGFYALKPRDKQNTTGREVLIFYKRLATPSLLPPENLDLDVISNKTNDITESYVIDLNIFLSLTKNRTEKELITNIMKAALSGEFTLFVTPEFKEELLRNKRNEDALLDLAESTLPVLPSILDNELVPLEKEIHEIVFPNRTSTRKKSSNDASDIRHLAYCVKHKKSAFLTEEKSILNAKRQLHEKYSLMVLSPADFKIEYLGTIENPALSVPLQNENNRIQLLDNPSYSDIDDFLGSLENNHENIETFFKKDVARGVNEKRVALVNDSIFAAYKAQTKGNKHDLIEGMLITDSTEFKSRDAVLEHLLECFLRLVTHSQAKKITLYIMQDAFDLENLCLKRGFQRAGETGNGLTKLIKASAPQLITKGNWKDFRNSFYDQTGISFPALIPNFSIKSQGDAYIHAVKNERGHELPLYKLESFISPSVVLLPERNAVLISIRPAFASDLLSRDDSMLPFPTREEALIRTEKVYYKTPSHKNFFRKGMPVVFYESKSGRGVIGSARIVSTEICSVDTALKTYRKYGVLTKQELDGYSDKSGNVQVIIFDNFIEFPNPLTLKELKNLGCAKANMVGPEKLSFDQLYNILHLGTSMPVKDVIISIQPNYVAKILSGKKTIELRKKPFPANGGVRIWIYTTKPSSSIEATAYVTEYEKDTPENIWKKYRNKCGISKKDFDEYYNGCKEAYALTLSNAKKLSRKIKLTELKELNEGFTPPQYFRYLKHNSSLCNQLLDCLPDKK